MGGFRHPLIQYLILILSCNLSFHVLSTTAQNTLTPNQHLSDGETLVSPNGAFKLGFFIPTSSTYRYIAIWYNNIPIQTAIWVANRETPLKATSGAVLVLSPDGNLAIRNLTGGVSWSTNTSHVSNPVVELLNSGNLVLTDGGYNESHSNSIVWQSFDYPSDTLLPGMKLGWDLRANRDRRITSWRSTSDPAPGPYSYGVDLQGVPELYIWNGSVPESRSGPWNGKSWSGIAPIDHSDLFSMQFISTSSEVYYTYEILNASVTSLMVLDQFGIGRILLWQSQQWELYSQGPADQCGRYGQCGAFGVCNTGNLPNCRCMTGFDPKSKADWALRNGTGGCVRRTPLNCSVTGENEFLKVSGVKLPETKEATAWKGLGLDQCSDWCLNNCSCKAYAFLSGASGCITWLGDLVDTRDLTDSGGEDLYVKVAASDLGKNPRKRRRLLVVVLVVVPVAVLILVSLMLLVWIKRRRFRGTKVSTVKSVLSYETNRTINLTENESSLLSATYHFSSIIEATDNFSYANKLGEGGFGPVYKGQSSEGQEIAVKRLAARSGQGLKEFENEILLIAKLQHRNLVRLLGYCIHGEEKILIYEYMPNKSLDYFLFDSTRRAQLDWGRRFQIIEGISQGLLYLHKHSRLRIIHRDLKASNILLDADMNPKISDFGMARIFGSNDTEATNRIVGTYGYMSPEYASEGLFSIKSDVYSFGVLLLEIVSGRRNSSYQRRGNTLNLIGYAWELWKEAKWLDLVDPCLNESMHETSRSIHVALLCVQESASDRPSMSAVISMLSSDSALPIPKQPAFFNVRIESEEELPPKFSEVGSVNEVTITAISGR